MCRRRLSLRRFTTNPNDEAAAGDARPHAKLRAYPIGVHDRAVWVGGADDIDVDDVAVLDGREALVDDARARDVLLACCCMSVFPPPGRGEEHPELERPAVFKGLTAKNREVTRRWWCDVGSASRHV